MGRKPNATAEQKAEWAAARQVKLAGLMDGLAGQVVTMTEQPEWTAMLAVAARFHRYSPNNIMLILMQRPDATRVAGFGTWAKLGRPVRKGERGISILAPVTSTRELEDRVTGEKSLVRSMRNVKPVAVFDISQTDGPDLPDGARTALLDADADSALYERIIGLVAAAEFGYAEVDEVGRAGALGQTDFVTREVVVKRCLSPADRLHTALHELAHIRLHSDRENLAPRAVRELEAESTAHVLMGALGYDSTPYTVGYVAGWAKGDVGLVRSTADRVLRLAHDVMEELEAAEADVAA